MRTLALVVLVLLGGCNDPEIVETRPVVDYDPWQWGAYADPPACRNADRITISADGSEITCLWECALYWTPGRVQLYRVEKGWRRGTDGLWREAATGDGTGVASVCETL